MAGRQFTTPLLIRGFGRSHGTSSLASLKPVPLHKRGVDEKQFQQLLFDHLKLLPINEIEPIFDNPVAVATELPVGGGSLDILLVNKRGFPTLVETKLWRNPEARREVVAQIIDYATAMSQWSYERLCEAVRIARGESQRDPLLPLMREEDEDFEERAFIDQVSQNLRLGRYLLLIVGDGIHEGVESMVDFLQRRPHLGFTLGLVEITLFCEALDSSDLVFVQPRIVARTKEVTRAIIEFRPSITPEQMTVTAPKDEGTAKAARPGTITEKEYFVQLKSAAPSQVEDFVLWVLDNAPKHDLTVQWMEAGPVLKYVHESGEFFNFGQLHKKGGLAYTAFLARRFFKLGLSRQICSDYLNEVVRLVSGASVGKIMIKDIAFETLDCDGERDWVPLSKLAPVKERWFEAIDKAIERIRQTLENR